MKTRWKTLYQSETDLRNRSSFEVGVEARELAPLSRESLRGFDALGRRRGHSEDDEGQAKDRGAEASVGAQREAQGLANRGPQRRPQNRLHRLQGPRTIPPRLFLNFSLLMIFVVFGFPFFPGISLRYFCLSFGVVIVVLEICF